MARYNGAVPRETEALSALPGIGRYTAHAIACFAHGRNLPVVDVNIQRVLSRIFRRMDLAGGTVSERDAWELAAKVLPAKAYDWNQALMDFGALVCTARSPKCESCPVTSVCLSSGRIANDITTRPKAEPAHRGIPRRIWRGAVVEALRVSPNPLSTAGLLRVVRPSGKAPSEKWLEEIVARLERDGVVSVNRLRGRSVVGLAT